MIQHLSPQNGSQIVRIIKTIVVVLIGIAQNLHPTVTVHVCRITMIYKINAATFYKMYVQYRISAHMNLFNIVLWYKNTSNQNKIHLLPLWNNSKAYNYYQSKMRGQLPLKRKHTSAKNYSITVNNIIVFQLTIIDQLDPVETTYNMYHEKTTTHLLAVVQLQHCGCIPVHKQRQPVIMTRHNVQEREVVMLKAQTILNRVK